MLIPRGLFVIGVGSHARSVADVALDLGVPALTFVDPSARCGQKFAGFPVVTAISELPDGWLVLAAAGDNFERQRQIEIAIERDLDPSCLGRSRSVLSRRHDGSTARARQADHRAVDLSQQRFLRQRGFRDKNGSRITSIEPYFPDAPHEQIELSSVGSYVLFDIAIFRSNIRFRGDYDHGLLIGFCEEAAKIGFKTFVDPAVSILHPVSAWRKQLWSCRRLQVFAKGVLKFDTPTPGAVFGEAYEELIRPWLDQWLGPVYGSGGTRRISIRRYPGEKTFDVRVDFNSSPGS